MHWIMSCKQVSMQISRSLDTPLPLSRQMGIRVHLMMCKFCRRYNRHLRLIHALLNREREKMLAKEQLSSEARERILKAIEVTMRQEELKR